MYAFTSSRGQTVWVFEDGEQHAAHLALHEAVRVLDDVEVYGDKKYHAARVLRRILWRLSNDVMSYDFHCGDEQKDLVRLAGANRD